MLRKWRCGRGKDRRNEGSFKGIARSGPLSGAYPGMPDSNRLSNRDAGRRRELSRVGKARGYVYRVQSPGWEQSNWLPLLWSPCHVYLLLYMVRLLRYSSICCYTVSLFFMAKLIK